MPRTFWWIPSWISIFLRSCTVQIPLQRFHSCCEEVLYWVHRRIQQSNPYGWNFGSYLWNGASVASKNLLNHPDIAHMLKRFRWVRCSYTHFLNPSQHHLLSLRALLAFSHMHHEWNRYICCAGAGASNGQTRPKQSSQRSLDGSGWQLQQDVFNEVAPNQ